MNIKIFFYVMFVGVLGAIGMPGAFAEGSVSFASDISPMMKERPVFGDFITRSFSIGDTGWGTRIDSVTMPHLGGARVGPYRFNAIWHSQQGDVPVTLVIDTKARFLDAHKREITGDDLHQAVFIRETLDSIEIEPATHEP